MPASIVLFLRLENINSILSKNSGIFLREILHHIILQVPKQLLYFQVMREASFLLFYPSSEGCPAVNFIFPCGEEVSFGYFIFPSDEGSLVW
jgi:hypothetical protein